MRNASIRYREAIAAAVFASAVTSASAQPMNEREAWKEKVAEAKARAAQQRLDSIAEAHRLRNEQVRNSVSAEMRRARMNSEAVLNDWSLQRGDIVSTVDGLFMFMGTGDNRSASDFVPLASPSSR